VTKYSPYKRKATLLEKKLGKFSLGSFFLLCREKTFEMELKLVLPLIQEIFSHIGRSGFLLCM